MATLVLTVVGGIVGGPVGAAIGAAIGQQADAAIFKPKGREGPRLADLKVQASTYGQQIPQLFGTMRVAGSVIWATDLIERRSKRGGGKGRPSTTEYSYSVSLAVALSSRRVRAIRRIWADGNLLRGAGGNFQERCIFRWYDGGEDQAVDPLIASAVGMHSASAFRGTAYVVLEDLELASFGNRIPSLTFEVEADAGPVDTGRIAETLLGEAGRCRGLWLFDGYAASGDRARDALSPLFDADRIRLVSEAGGWRLVSTGALPAPVALADYRATFPAARAGDAGERRRAPLSAVPGTIRLRHYEPERDYQLGQQAGQVTGGGIGEERIDLPAVLGAAAARALVQRLATAAADGRETIVLAADLAALALPVGGLLTLADGGVWRIMMRTVGDAGVKLELARHEPVAAAAPAADPGTPVVAPDWGAADAMVAVFDLPARGPVAASAPQVIVAAAGGNDGWRGADIWVQPAPGAAPVAAGSVRAAAAMGTLAAPLAPMPGHLIDCRSSLLVRLANPSMTLESIDERELSGGANAAMAGDELIQFAHAEQVGPDMWRLSRLLRGQGMGGASGAHGAGAPFLLLDDAALLPLSDELARLTEGGAAVLQWMPRSGHTMTAMAIAASGRALRPLPPAHGRIVRDGSGGARVAWIRRSRADAGWRDHVDLPLGEGRERWRVTVTPPVASLDAWEVSEPVLHLDDATLAALPPGSALAIHQQGDFALSRPLILPLP